MSRPLTEFAAALEAAFDAATKRTGRVERALDVGGRRVRVASAGDHVDDVILPSVGHLADATPSEAALHVSVWDSHTSGVPLPSSPWRPDQFGPTGNIVGDPDPRFVANVHLDARGPKMVSFFDRTRSRAWVWMRDALDAPTYVRGSPLVYVLAWALEPHGIQVVHAAAVGIDGCGVLLAGPGGRGKSSTALACLMDGMQLVGDDYCAIEVHPAPVVHSLYRIAKLDRHGQRRFPELLPHLINPDHDADDKALVDLARFAGVRLVRRLDLVGVLLPRVAAGEPTHITPVSAAEAMRGLAPSTLDQLSGLGRGAFDSMANLVATLPCYELRLGASRTSVAEAIRRFLPDASSAAPAP